MELEQDKIDLIEKDLFDDFFNETYKRSLLIVKSVTSENTLEAYLRKIATTSIINVLKNEGRLRRTKSGFIPTETVSFDAPDYSEISITYEPVDIQDTPEDLAVKKDILFNLRFEKGLTQNEIASELNLSQSEVSKRLFKLMNEVKQTL